MKKVEIKTREEEEKYTEEEIKVLEDRYFYYLNLADDYYMEFLEQVIKINIQDEEIEELKTRNNKQEEEIKKIETRNNKLKERNQELEDLHIKSTPKWNIDCDKGWKINPETDELEQYSIPKKIDKDKISTLTLSDDLKWMSFKYEDENYKNKEFKIPRSLAEQLKIISPLINPINKDEIEIQKIQNPEDIKKYLKEREINTKLKYWDAIINLLSHYRYQEIQTKDFMNCYKFGNPETVRICIKKLIEVGLIKREKKGIYIVLFNYE
jgi:hypothetical protein